jgi:halocyanin-like protein
MGMKGALVVGDAPASIGGEASSNETAGGQNATDTTNASGPTDENGSAPANGSETDTDTPERTFDGWLANTDNYKQVVDKTGTDEVRVAVGTKGNGGNFAFDPPAIHVDPGTTVVWEWVSGDGSYSVVDNDGLYRSDAVAEEGNLYAVRFDGDGLSKYECTSHSGRGMRGVVIVGEGVVPSLDLTGLAALGGITILFGGAFYRGVKLHNETSSGPTPNREE